MEETQSTRRALIFNVPKGPETHYSKIKGKPLGEVWAPLYHAYSYYMPRDAFPSPDVQVAVDDALKWASRQGLELAALQNLIMLPLGGNAVLKNMIGSVVFAEAESVFATWDGHVTFGSSHATAHWIGYSLTTVLQQGFSLWTVPCVLWALTQGLDFFVQWEDAGFRAVSDLDKWIPFRTDHVAHIGGIIAGVVTALATRNKTLY
jgi:hypothetical protein